MGIESSSAGHKTPNTHVGPPRRHDAQTSRPRAPPRLVARPHPNVVGLARRQSFDHSLERGLRTLLGRDLPRFLFIPDIPKRSRTNPYGSAGEGNLELVSFSSYCVTMGLPPRPPARKILPTSITRFADAQLQLPPTFIYNTHGRGRTQPAGRLYDQRLRPPRPAR